MKKLLFVIVVIIFPGVATSADSPPAMYIDQGTCPFECCTYRAWNTVAETVTYNAPHTNAQVVGVLKVGDRVEAVSGEVHASPVRFVVKKSHAAYKPGDLLWVYTYRGEGYFTVWRDGAMHRAALGFSPYGSVPGARCEYGEHCWGELAKELTFRWWVKVRSREGWEGWTDQPEHFGNKDVCG